MYSTTYAMPDFLVPSHSRIATSSFATEEAMILGDSMFDIDLPHLEPELEYPTTSSSSIGLLKQANKTPFIGSIGKTPFVGNLPVCSDLAFSKSKGLESPLGFSKSKGLESPLGFRKPNPFFTALYTLLSQNCHDSGLGNTEERMHGIATVDTANGQKSQDIFRMGSANLPLPSLSPTSCFFGTTKREQGESKQESQHLADRATAGATDAAKEAPATKRAGAAAAAAAAATMKGATASPQDSRVLRTSGHSKKKIKIIRKADPSKPNSLMGKRQAKKEQHIVEYLHKCEVAINALKDFASEHIRRATNFPALEPSVLHTHLPPGTDLSPTVIRADRSPILPRIFYRSLESEAARTLHEHWLNIQKLLFQPMTKHRNCIVNNRRQHLKTPIDASQIPLSNYELTQRLQGQTILSMDKKRRRKFAKPNSTSAATIATNAVAIAAAGAAADATLGLA